MKFVSVLFLQRFEKKLNKEYRKISKLGRSIRIGNELFIEIFAYFRCFINRNLQ